MQSVSKRLKMIKIRQLKVGRNKDLVVTGKQKKVVTQAVCLRTQAFSIKGQF